jgi:hypothetical protein
MLCWIVWKFGFEMFDEIKSVFSTYQRRLMENPYGLIKSVISTYQQRQMENPYVLKTSYGRTSLGDDGEANKLFLTFLFSDTDLGI